MDVPFVVGGIIFLLTVSASPEIPSKGKHTRILDSHQTALDDLDMPRFAEPIVNVTVSVGRDALLSCVVENLKGYKVAWVRVDTQTILSIHHNVISQNNRISLTYSDHRSWYLHIKEVEESDRGWYMCQINTDPMRSRKGYLQVVVPPIIIESMTSNDMVVREGLNVTLMCKARGYPEPYVMWRREDGEEMLIAGEHVNVVDGELLQITKVSRLHMGAYLCVASNGVPPSISKRVHLRVQFPPMLSIPNQLEGAYVGQDVVLECHTEAYPLSINYWTTERGDMIISDTSRAGDKYETTSTVNGYTKYMKLKIRSVGANDFGTYRCVAKNSLGETDGNIKLDEMPAPTTILSSDNGLANRSADMPHGKRRNRNKSDLHAWPDYGVEEWRNGAGNSIEGDNNQTPMRNPPGAFHNGAGSLAQHNLLGSIIHWIKVQSLGIFKRLSLFPSARAQKSAARNAHQAARMSERTAAAERCRAAPRVGDDVEMRLSTGSGPESGSEAANVGGRAAADSNGGRRASRQGIATAATAAAPTSFATAIDTPETAVRAQLSIAALDAGDDTDTATAAALQDNVNSNKATRNDCWQRRFALGHVSSINKQHSNAHRCQPPIIDSNAVACISKLCIGNANNDDNGKGSGSGNNRNSIWSVQLLAAPAPAPAFICMVIFSTISCRAMAMTEALALLIMRASQLEMLLRQLLPSSVSALMCRPTSGLAKTPALPFTTNANIYITPPFTARAIPLGQACQLSAPSSGPTFAHSLPSLIWSSLTHAGATR